MFEMVAGFKDTRVAGLDLMCVVAVTGIVGEISQGFAKLDTSRDDVHTGSCIRKHEHNWPIDLVLGVCKFDGWLAGWLI